MANLKADFEKAVAESKSLPEKPDNATLLQIYAKCIAGQEDAARRRIAQALAGSES